MESILNLTKNAQKGHQVQLITTSVPNRPETFKRGIDVVALHSTRKYSKVWWKKSLEYFQTIETDVVFSISAGAYGLLPYKSDFNIPFVLQIHGTSWGEILAKLRTRNPYQWIKSVKNFYTLPIDLSNIPKFDVLVAVGPRVAQDLENFPFNLVVDIRKVKTITNGIDTSLFNICDRKERIRT